MGQSKQLTTESAAMRAFESAIERANRLPPRAQRRVLDWAEEQVGEALAKAGPGPVVRDLADAGSQGEWAGVSVGSPRSGAAG